MTARPTWVRRLGTALAAVAGLGVIAVWFTYSQVTAELDLDAFKRPNELDGKEAIRKLKLYKEALATSRRGFIRLSEIEINSYLQLQYFSGPNSSDPHALAGPARLLNSRVELLNGGGVWYCWVRKTCLGRPVDLVWGRTFRLEPLPDRWAFRTKSMRLGRLKLPRTLWPFVRTKLGSVDQVFASQSEWLTRLPTLEIRTNEASVTPELRLFTYSVGGPGLKTSP